MSSINFLPTEITSLVYRLKSEALGRGVECEIVTPDRISELCPLVRTDDLLGGLWIPGDCVANPFEICVALSVLAQGLNSIQILAAM